MNKKFWIRRRAIRRQIVPDVSFVPPLQRRRLSLLQKIMFSITQELAGDEKAYTTFFSSREGEYRLTRRLVHDFNESADVSPWRFSSSVYNAAPGLFSVFTGNQAPYSALAAGEDTIECGLIEAIFEPGDRVWVYAEEPDGGYGCGAFLNDSSAGTEVLCTEGKNDRPAVGFESVIAFLRGKSRLLEGRYVTLEISEGVAW